MVAPGGGMTMEVRGLPEFDRTINQAERDIVETRLPDMQAATIVSTAAKGRAPKVSGALAASVHPQATQGGAEVVSNLIYSGVIHGGWPAHNIRANPFITDAADSTQPLWSEPYSRHADRVVGKVHGI